MLNVLDSSYHVSCLVVQENIYSKLTCQKMFNKYFLSFRRKCLLKYFLSKARIGFIITEDTMRLYVLQNIYLY